jgi:hypothetical protein
MGVFSSRKYLSVGGRPDEKDPEGGRPAVASVTWRRLSDEPRLLCEGRLSSGDLSDLSVLDRARDRLSDDGLEKDGFVDTLRGSLKVELRRM